MHAAKFVLKTGAFFLLSLVCAVLPASALLQNQGSDSVMLEIRRQNGTSQKVNLYPGQSVEFGADAVEVELIPRSSGARTREEINVKVIERNGTVGTLDKYGQPYVLGRTEFFEAPTVLKPGRAINTGNNTVDIRVNTAGGLSQTHSLYIKDAVTLPKSTQSVQVLSNRLFRGDEVVSVNVIMPDGRAHTISSLGGIVKLEEPV